MIPLNTPIKSLSRVGAATSNKLKRLGLNTVEDLLLNLPFRFEDFSTTKNIEDLLEGESVTIEGDVELLSARTSSRVRMKMTEALIKDETDTIKVVWFNQPYIAKVLKVGDRIRIQGVVKNSKYGLGFQNPNYEKIYGEKSEKGLVSPIYYLTEGITQKQIRSLVTQVLGSIGLFSETFPTDLLKKLEIKDIYQALRYIHDPKSLTQAQEGLKRFSVEELFYIMLRSAKIKYYMERQKSTAVKFFEDEIKNFVKKLPFTLTNDQRKSIWAIIKDMDREVPMNRLLEGDVGSGKTVVSAVAAYNTVLNSKQVVVLAPTLVLAAQHYESFIKLFKGFNLKIGLLTQADQLINGQKIKKTEFLEALNSGEVNIVIGTHAVLSEGVFFKDLGLVVVDEQHRFGVAQRQLLKSRNKAKYIPHFLSMTATPIPRSLALITYGELDVSIITQKPAGRKDIKTLALKDSQRVTAYDSIAKEIENGQQAYVVCPLIDASDTLGVASVKEEYEKLRKTVFKKFRIGLMHGKLSSKEKKEIMSEFANRKIDILVSTSVIEVGVDVPNATVMLIEGAERFGLAQLHQFRGRVGRSDLQSYCYLISSTEVGDYEVKRLKHLEKTQDGFVLAEFDLQERGPGEVFGHRQSGLASNLSSYKLDKQTIYKVSEVVKDFISNDPEGKNNPLIYKKLEEKMMITHLE